MSDNTHSNRGNHSTHDYRDPKKTEQSEDKPKRPGMTFATEQIIIFGRDGIRRRLVRRHAVIETPEKKEG